MRKTGIHLLAALLIFSVVSISYAQPWRGGRGSGGWGMGAQYQRMYNVGTVETIAGEIVSIDQMTPMGGMSRGVHLQVKTDKETLAVHLGPEWFLDRLDSTLENGDKIEVKGSRVTISGAPVIIAAEVRKGDQVLILRDDAGIPIWAGWRR